MAGEIKIDTRVVERLKRWIIMTENRNIKTRSKGDADMVKAIKKRIEEEANATAIN